MNNSPPAQIQLVQASAASSTDWPYDPELPGVVAKSLVARTPSGGKWFVEIDNDAATAGKFPVATGASAPRVLSAFVGIHSLAPVLAAVLEAANHEFGKDRVSTKESLVTDFEMQEDLVRIEIDVVGLSRDEFKAMREAFEA